jgi:hypothetical protein
MSSRWKSAVDNNTLLLSLGSGEEGDGIKEVEVVHLGKSTLIYAPPPVTSAQGAGRCVNPPPPQTMTHVAHTCQISAPQWGGRGALVAAAPPLPVVAVLPLRRKLPSPQLSLICPL